MNSILTDYSIGWAASFVAALVTLPLWRRACLRLGLLDPPGVRKLQDQPIPLAGGLTVLGSLAIALGVAFGLSHEVRSQVAAESHTWGAIFGGAVLMTLLGVMDDRHVLRPGPKFMLQLVVALALASAGLRVTLFVPSPAFQYGVTVLWMLTVINAFNFMDNMNGLCAGLGSIAAGTFAAAAARQDQHAEALFCLVVCGALMGFLPWNYPRAKAFLGDAGSHLVGFCMAVLAMLPTFHTAQHPHPFAVLKPLLILAIPLLDLVWMVVLRTKAGKPFYIGDTNHLSHRLVRRGLSPPQAVAVIWLLAASASALALWL